MQTVGLIIYPNFQSLGLAVSTVFEHANTLVDEPVYELVLVSEHGGIVKSSQGFGIDTVPMNSRSFDTVIVIGDNECAPQSDGMLDYLREASMRSRRVAAVCTGAFILAAAGLLNGRRATTHWHFARAFQRAYPLVRMEEDRIFINDGHIWTSAGMTAGIDLALALVENDMGVTIARSVARKLVVYHRRAGGQSQFSALLELDARSDRVQNALAYAKENLSAELSVEELAGAASLSPRQFSRLFRDETGQSPAKAVEHLRVEAARVMMESGRHPIEVIARETGFGDRERMRRAFLRAFGQSPQAIQRTAGLQ